MRSTPFHNPAPAADNNPAPLLLIFVMLVLGPAIASAATDPTADAPVPRGERIVSPPLNPIESDDDRSATESEVPDIPGETAEPAVTGTESGTDVEPEVEVEVESEPAAADTGPSPEEPSDEDLHSAAEEALESGDHAHALQLLYMASARGDAGAQTRLGDFYMQGLGVAQSHDRAMLWYRRAAKLGYARAQYNLGNMYLLGEGVLQDDETARDWYARAAEHGHAGARSNLENLERRMATRVSPLATQPPPPPVAEMQEEVLTAMETESEAALRESAGPVAEADTRTTEAATGGRVITPPIDMLEPLEPIAAIADDPDQEIPDELQDTTAVADADPVAAMEAPGETATPDATTTDARQLFEQGQRLALGDGLGRNPTAAIDYYRRAAELGYAPAQYRLGAAYHYGDGVARDTVEAAAWYRRAARQGYTMAQRNLGNLYLQGEGVAQDNVQALAWLSLVATRGSEIDRRQHEQLAASLSDEELEQARQLASELNNATRD